MSYPSSTGLDRAEKWYFLDLDSQYDRLEKPRGIEMESISANILIKTLSASILLM